MDKVRAYQLSVFPHGTDSKQNGGNPTTIFLDGDDLTAAEMQSLAKKSGHECAFVFSASKATSSKHDLSMRYWVPNHEMEMCGHATVGAIWLLNELKELSKSDTVLISTQSGDVEARVTTNEDGRVSVLVSQPSGFVDEIPRDLVSDVFSALRITPDDLLPGTKVQNGRTSRTKTLVPIKNRDILNSLRPDFDAVRRVCEELDSTGLYPYVVLDAPDKLVEARQFPKSSGYAEDPATGIAAAALVFGLVSNGVLATESIKPTRVRQGWAMGKPSEIVIYTRDDGEHAGGCWISGNVRRVSSDSELNI